MTHTRVKKYLKDMMTKITGTMTSSLPRPMAPVMVHDAPATGTPETDQQNNEDAEREEENVQIQQEECAKQPAEEP